MTDVFTPEDDPRLAHTSVEVEGRKIIDDHELLAGFERILERGEANERDDGEEDTDDDESITEAFDAFDGLCGFIDRHGRQLLWLALKGAGLS